MASKVEVILLRERVAMALRRDIFEGALAPGAELNQEEVAGRLGISRMPVREALQTLEREGLVRWASGNRAVVCDWTVDDLLDFYQVRSLIEGEAAARAATRHESLPLIVAAFDESDAIARSESDPRSVYGAASERFHRSVWLASGSPRIGKIAAQLFTGLPLHLHELVPGTVQPSNDDHRAILDAIRSGDPEAARREMSRHILDSFPKMRSHFARNLRLENA